MRSGELVMLIEDDDGGYLFVWRWSGTEWIMVEGIEIYALRQ